MLRAAGVDLRGARAVFVFGILRHVPTWRAALAELARVLRPS
jgi:ubiquinone/menaquinone biosynthesis C-methylase UbiE